MNRQDIINKTMTKMGMLGDPRDPIDDRMKDKILKRFWNEDEPRNVISVLQSLFRKENPSKEAKQDLFKFFKLKGLFKRILRHKDMEKAWRLMLKEHGLRGFSLEN